MRSLSKCFVCEVATPSLLGERRSRRLRRLLMSCPAVPQRRGFLPLVGSALRGSRVGLGEGALGAAARRTDAAVVGLFSLEGDHGV